VDPQFADKATRTFCTRAINNDMTKELLLKIFVAFYLKSLKNFQTPERAAANACSIGKVFVDAGLGVCVRAGFV
jgi:hypothetical protein